MDIDRIQDPVISAIDNIRISPRAAYNRLEADQRRIEDLNLKVKQLNNANTNLRLRDCTEWASLKERIEALEWALDSLMFLEETMPDWDGDGDSPFQIARRALEEG